MTSKKNWTLRAAVLMLALVLITSCFVGGTFAKYVTSGSGTDSARVAKFGVTVTANGDVFAKEYDTNDQTVVGTIAKSVISTDKVVAPGTTSNGDFVAATITGTTNWTLPACSLKTGRTPTANSTALWYSRSRLRKAIRQLSVQTIHRLIL